MTTAEELPEGVVPLRPNRRGPNALVASARRLTSKNLKRIAKAKDDRRDDVWDMYDLIGEQRFLANAIGGRVGAAFLYIGKLDPNAPDAHPLRVEDNPKIAKALDGFGETPGARAQMLSRMGVNLFQEGDGYFIGFPRDLWTKITTPPTRDGTTLMPEPAVIEVDADGEEVGIKLDDLIWRAFSTDEVFEEEGKVKVKIEEAETGDYEMRPEDALIVRVWRPHPRKWWKADSPALSSLPIMRELVGLTMHVSSQIDSRLMGAGIQIVPQSAMKAAKEQAGVDPDDDQTNPFIDAAIEAAETAIRDRDSAAAKVPIFVGVPDAVAEEKFWPRLQFDTELDAQAVQLREEALRRLAMGQDVPPEILFGVGGMNHWGCLRDTAEILTDRGWVTHDQLCVGDVVLTLNHATGLSEWQPVGAVHRYQVTDAPMRRLVSKNHMSVSTLNHRWATVSRNGTRRWATSETLTPQDNIPIAAANASLPSEAKYGDALVEVAAWYATDAYRKGGHIQIHQSHTRNPDRVAAIRSALSTAFGTDGFTERIQQNASAFGGPITVFTLQAVAREALLSAVGDDEDRVVSLNFVNSLTLAQLHLFLNTYCEGDGWHWRQGVRDVWLKNPRQLDAFEFAGILAGYGVSRREHNGGTYVTLLKTRQVNPVRAAKVGAAVDEVIRHTGTIWCPSVANRTWLAREDGTTYFTGNSWMVKEDTVTTHVEPPLALICDAITSQYLWPVLEQNNISEDEAHQYVVWYSVAHLIQRPNRLGDAKDLHKEGVISDDTLREEAGYTDDDAPTAELSPAQTIVVDMIRQAPSLAQTIGIALLAEQVQAMLDGGAIPANPAPAEGDSSGDAPVDGPPETDGEPAEPEAVAASAVPEVLTPDAIIDPASGGTVVHYSGPNGMDAAVMAGVLDRLAQREPMSVNVNVSPPEMPFTVNVEPTPVTVHVEPTPVTVEAPTVDVHVDPTPVHVEAAQVNVSPTPVHVDAPHVTVEAAAQTEPGESIIRSGVAGAVDIPEGYLIVAVSATGGEAPGSVTIAGGDAIPVEEFSAFNDTFDKNPIRAIGAGSVVFVNTSSFYVRAVPVT